MVQVWKCRGAGVGGCVGGAEDTWAGMSEGRGVAVACDVTSDTWGRFLFCK